MMAGANLDDALNRARVYLGLTTDERPAFATPTVARERPTRGTAQAPKTVNGRLPAFV